MSNRLRVLVGNLGKVSTDLEQQLEQEDFAVTGIAKIEQLLDLGKLQEESDVVLLFAPSMSEAVLRTVEQVASESGKPVAVCCEDASRKAIQSAVSAGVSAYAVSANRVRTAVNLAVANHSCISELKKDPDEHEQALLERRIVERAKLIVMARRYLDEAHAHTLLRTRAVQCGMRLVDLARTLANADDLVI